VEESKTSLLSVVIPTMGRPILIRTVESLLATGFEALEILVCGKIPDAEVEAKLKALVERDARVEHFSIQYLDGDSSRKKNFGAEKARADVVAFIDDDVVVAPDWPGLVLEAFEDESVGLISGPSLVPDDINYSGRLAGLALSSGAAGYVAERYLKGGSEKRMVDWDRIIGCNAAYRKSVFEAIGGFPSEFYPGEEMIAAFRAEKIEEAKLVFIPDAWVYHYPRQSVRRFCRQMWTYGATRIRLIRAGVEYSTMNLVPAFFVLALVALPVVSVFWGLAWWLWVFVVVSYAAASLYFALCVVFRSKKVSDIGVWWTIVIMHICYGAAEWYEFFLPNKDWSES
jgi:cellulose synthase/poly-beta-1,6-N-acetylglucosamine synthase-like glycosyltransferase